MPENNLKYGEKVFLIVMMVIVVGTCAGLLVLCGSHG